MKLSKRVTGAAVFLAGMTIASVALSRDLTIVSWGGNYQDGNDDPSMADDLKVPEMKKIPDVATCGDIT